MPATKKSKTTKKDTRGQKARKGTGPGAPLIDRIEDVENSSLEAVRRFVDTVDRALPSLGDDAPRRRIIDAAFRMTEQLMGASNKFAQDVIDLTERTVGDGQRRAAVHETPRPTARKTTAKKAPATKRATTAGAK